MGRFPLLGNVVAQVVRPDFEPCHARSREGLLDFAWQRPAVTSVDTETRKHDIRVNGGTAMKNVTITMPEQTLAKVRVEAAKAGKSVSRFMTDLAEARMERPKRDPAEAMRLFLAGPLYDLTDENGNAPTRDQIYDRSDFR